MGEHWIITVDGIEYELVGDEALEAEIVRRSK